MIDFTTTDADVQKAAKILQNGGLIAFPTETVYGLGADATQESAVKAIYDAKGRPSFNPLIAHFGDPDVVKTFVEISDQAQKLMDAFWPGALTLVLPMKPDIKIAQSVTAGLPTLAVRMPDNPVALSLLRFAATPIAAPSANPSGQISPTTADHVRAGLSEKIDGLIDGGPCAIGLESTILVLEPKPTILRPGGVTRQQISDILRRPVAFADDATPLQAPGQMISHYAPKASVRLGVTKPKPDEVYLGFGPMECDVNLSPNGVLTEAAETLFAALHHLDGLGKPIAVAPIPNTGVGRAINDRLKRAAAPRN